ncbi:retrovirus-related pol polyprotein from transposon TNT 1-94 [Tanacetum coccineum]
MAPTVIVESSSNDIYCIKLPMLTKGLIYASVHAMRIGARSLLEVSHGAVAVPNKCYTITKSGLKLISKGSFRSSSNSQNVAFLSMEDTSSSNEVNTANSVSNASGHNSQGQASSSSYTDDLMDNYCEELYGSKDEPIISMVSWLALNISSGLTLEAKRDKREYSVARTPQQNGVAIEAARTMLADSLLPTVFWAEAVNTACYVLNRVLVTKPHNKTPYELIISRAPSISFMRPFGCPVTILNILDPLGKFDGKAEKGFLVGYSVNNKAFRVFNTETRKVEDNLHVNFLENKPNVAG